MMSKFIWTMTFIAAFVCCLLAVMCVRVICLAAPFEAPLPERDESLVNITINMRPHFEDGASDGDLYIVNPEHNAYLMEYVICLKETAELVYQSPLMAPGTQIERDKLLIKLPKGEHEARAEIYAYAPHDEGNPVSKYAAQIIITIEN